MKAMSARKLIAINNVSRCGYDQKQSDCSFSFATNQLNHCNGGDCQMSGPIELINIKEMMGSLLIDGKLVEQYKVEKCDSCMRIERLDQFGYQKSHSQENLIWFCGQCR
jgi:hypothetical protein